MSQPSLVEKLRYADEKNLLIQGLPSSVEKQFIKLSFSKNVTPLLRRKKIEWALIFAVNENQLSKILGDVLPAMHEDGKLWVAYPKTASKIVSDLNREGSWTCLTCGGYNNVEEVTLDHVWSAIWWSNKMIMENDTELLEEAEAEADKN